MHGCLPPAEPASGRYTLQSVHNTEGFNHEGFDLTPALQESSSSCNVRTAALVQAQRPATSAFSGGKLPKKRSERPPPARRGRGLPATSRRTTNVDRTADPSQARNIRAPSFCRTSDPVRGLQKEGLGVREFRGWFKRLIRMNPNTLSPQCPAHLLSLLAPQPIRWAEHCKSRGHPG